MKFDSRIRSSSPEAGEQIELINHSLDIDALFWDRDSHGLFDYEFKHLKAANITAIGCSQLARDNYSLKCVMPKLGTPEEYQLLLSFVYKHGQYWIYHTRSLYKPNGEIDDKYNHFEQAWLIIRLMN